MRQGVEASPSWGRWVSWPLVGALLWASLGGTFVWFYYAHYAPGVYSDFDQIWLGARALLDFEDPYQRVAAGQFPWPLYYPVPALLLGIPFAPFPLHLARVFFGATTAGFCAYAIFRWRPYAWPLLCTGPFMHALQRGQWSPLLVASVFLPSLSVVLAAKPTIGSGIFAYRPNRVAVVACVTMAVLAMLWVPNWPWRWLESRDGAYHLVIPALLPGGWILLASLLRWKRPEGRLLSVLSVVPQTFSMYELVSLGLIPRGLREALSLALAFNVLYVVSFNLYGPPLLPSDTYPGYVPGSWIPALTLGYLPALWIALGPFPLWHRPENFGRWAKWRRLGYTALWTGILGLMLVWGAGGGWLIWRHLLGPMLGFSVPVA